MESMLYKSIFARGEARGEALGELRAYAKTIHKLLSRQLGVVDIVVRDRIAMFSERAVIETRHDEALDVDNPEAARALSAKILLTLVTTPPQNPPEAE